jgi:exonuclease III
MKLITLNMWGGRVVEPLKNFLEKYSDVDVFLFQEIYDESVETIITEYPRVRVSDILINHRAYFRPAESNGFGLAIFVKKDIKVLEEGDVFVFGVKNAVVGEKWWEDIGKNLQYMTIENLGKKYNLFNIHGLWQPTGKSDTPNRLEQSKNIIKFIRDKNENVVLGGDFNLRPDTQSIKMIEKELKLNNLIDEFKVTSTRTPLYTRSDEKYADHIFVSPNMRVKDFQVLTDVVSDHAALYVEFE